MPLEKRRRRDYTIGWICALYIEMAAATAMLDEEHEKLRNRENDQNAYVLGAIHGHNVVITCLPSGVIGTVSAAVVAQQMLSTFPSIQFCLMVGIGGGVPSSESDIRLGDVVVSMPTPTSGGVVQYDYGKTLESGKFQRTAYLNKPPQVLLNAAAGLQSRHVAGSSRIPQILANLARKNPRRAHQFTYCGRQHDRLFVSEYAHVGPGSTCGGCDSNQLVERPERADEYPIVHYGLIASGNQVMKDAATRDRLARELNVKCFEMEAAGLMDHRPCLVIRGICDYCDSHKNKQWQSYAAATAAAYAKELLAEISAGPGSSEVHSQADDMYNVSFDLTGLPVVDDFVGRGGELAHLWEILQPDKPKLRKLVVLHGLGGMGKTQIALQFARMRKDDFTAILWLDARDKETLLGSLASFQPKIPASSTRDDSTKWTREQRARKTLEWLAADENTRWLAIFDDVGQYIPRDSSGNDHGYDISEWLPPADHGSIIITTRRLQNAALGKSRCIQRLTCRESVQLLVNTSGLAGNGTGSTANNEMSDLADRLGGLPLAVAMAGSFIRSTGISPRDYLEKYEKSWVDIQNSTEPLQQYSNGNLLTTWKISYDEVQKSHGSAARLLTLLSYFDNQDIWFGLFQKHSPDSSYMPKWLCDVICTESKFLAAIEPLLSFSFIETRRNDGAYSMHPVVQDWSHHALVRSSGRNPAELGAIAIISVANTLPSIAEPDSYTLQRRLLPHANRILALLRMYPCMARDVESIEALNHLGMFYKKQGKLQEAEEMYIYALHDAAAPNSVPRLQILCNLAALYRDAGRLAEAEELYQRALTGCAQVQPVEIGQGLTLRIVNNLGNLYGDQRKLLEAEQMYLSALPNFMMALGVHHPCTLTIVNNLATIYSDSGKFAEAEQMYSTALTRCVSVLGPEHTATLTMMTNLGKVYIKQRKLEMAVEIYQRAWAGYVKTVGPDHGTTTKAKDIVQRLLKYRSRRP